MQSRITRLKYSTIAASRFHPFRVTSAAGLVLGLVLLSACGGGGGSGSDCDPTVEDCEIGGGGIGDDDDVGGGGGSGGDDNDGGGGNHNPASKPPKFDEWKQNMSKYGHDLGQYLGSSASFDDRRGAVYYDAQRVFMQIAEFTGEKEPWTTYAERASDIYKRYVDDHDGQLASYWVFTQGFLMDYETNGDSDSRDYIMTLRDRHAYSDPTRSIADGWFATIRCREVAYGLQTQIAAEKAGADRQEDKLERYVDMALGHIEIWTTNEYRTSRDDWKYISAFMGGLTASALIDYQEHLKANGESDDRVLPAIRELADWMWREMWVPNAEGSNYGAFEYRQYNDGRSSDPSGDLNMLIGPMYGWLYKETGDSKYLERGDEIFAGGVELAWLGGGKQFNQNYRDSFNYVNWRQEGVERHGD